MEKKRVKIVMLPQGKRKAIAKAMNVSQKTVSLAINGHCDNSLADRIKYVAMKEFGGIAVVYYNNEPNQCDTERTTEGFNAVWGDRVELVYNEKTQVAGVYIDGELKDSQKVKTIAEYMNYQCQVQKIVEQLI